MVLAERSSHHGRAHVGAGGRGYAIYSVGACHHTFG
jgi:hypothetical protein